MDVPDVAATHEDDTYYMSSVTMHLSPGVPVKKPEDLVNWDFLGNASDTLSSR